MKRRLTFMLGLVVLCGFGHTATPPNLPPGSSGHEANANQLYVTTAAGVMATNHFDALNRLTNTVWKLNASTLASFAYHLGRAGNRTNLSESVNGTSRTYAWQYDPVYRLTNETISALGTLGYGYDVVGNRTNRVSSGGVSNLLPTTNSALNTNDWLTTDSYDSNGNTTNSASKSYLYDVENRLTNFNNGAVLLGYNGDGTRVSKTVAGATTYYLVDEHSLSGYAQVVEEHQSTGGAPTLMRIYNHGLELVSQRDVSGPATNYFVYDGHGSTRMLLDTAGAVNQTFAYDAYGTLIASNGTPATAYLYCGEQFDKDVGFYYLRARYLNPDTGRFWTMDSFEGRQSDPLSLHKYLYAHNDPVNGVDPSGHEFNLQSLQVTVLNMARIATQIAIRTYTVKARVSSAIDGFNAIQEVAAGFDDGLDEDDLEAVLGLAQNYLIERLKSKLIGGALGVAARGAGQAVAAARTGITSLGRGRINFRGFEVRAARDMSHVGESTLRAMKAEGFAARTKSGASIELHHMNQNPRGPLVEIPERFHNKGNSATGNQNQHPFGNTLGGGLSEAERQAHNAWRIEYWKARATEELMRRGLNPDL